MSSRGARVAVVGATGVVGTTMLKLLRERAFPASEIVPFASERSAGRELGGGIVVRALNDDADLSGFDIALFSAGASRSREWGPRFVEHGAVVVDNSSAFRRDPEIPLVVSEVNPHTLEHHRGLIANPNCSTMALVVALAPIHRAVGVERLVVSTYQSVSGTGKAAIDELDAQAHASLHGMSMPAPEIYPEPIGFNVIGAAGSFADGDDYTDEERKMKFETRKILEDESIGVAVTCVRVPVRVSHSLSVNVQTREPLSAAEAQRLLARAPGVKLDELPTPLKAEGRDDVLVGRVRDDDSHPRALNLWVVGDNLRKGAATNAIQIAELVVGAPVSAAP
jgi:aspartate-semialdehyde dehydrogenase